MSQAAIVTGGASGIGLAIASQLVEQGYQVLICDLHKARLAEAAEALGENVITLFGDVSDPAVISKMTDMAFEAFGQVDLVFANAGLGINAPLLNATPDQFDTTFGVNTKGAWMTVQAVAQRWLETGASGKLCITGSEHSLGFQHAGNGLYTAAKHAVLGLADVLRHELPENISISVLCPGLVATNIYDTSHIEGTRELPPQAKAFSAAVMAKGMPAREVAAKAIAGTRAGEFLIVTHAIARDAAEQRWQDIDTAFAKQAPRSEDSDKYLVTKVIDEVRAEYRSRQK